MLSLLTFFSFSEGKPEKCDQCEKSYDEKSQLEAHIKKAHTRERPFKCSLCSKAFFTRKKMSEHIKITHSTERPYKCSRCQLSFKGFFTLKNHEQKHLKEGFSRPRFNEDWNQRWILWSRAIWSHIKTWRFLSVMILHSRMWMTLHGVIQVLKRLPGVQDTGELICSTSPLSELILQKSTYPPY